MHPRFPRRPRLSTALALAAVAALVVAAAASAHARIDPPVSLAGKLQLYSLVVPTEKAKVTTTKIVLTVPAGFSIDSFVPTPGWHRVLQQTGSGDSAVIQTVTWTGGSVPSGDDSFFQFLAEATKPGTYTFQVRQTYSDGSLVDWTGPETSDSPGPAIEVRSSLGGGGTSLLTIIALAVGAVGVIVGGVALVAGGGSRPVG